MKMANEVVRHHNDLNTVVMRKWTSEEMNFFFAILTKLKDTGTDEIVLDKYELADIANYSLWHKKRFADTVDKLAKKVMDLRYIERTSNSVAHMALFTYFRVDWKDDYSDMSATISVSPKFEYILNKLSANFTQYELAEFTQIRSTYAKTAYRLLKQWRSVGRREFEIEEFKTLLDTPKTYRSSEIDRTVIKPILKELGQYFKGLKCKKIKSNKKGNPVIGYEFTWVKDDKTRSEALRGAKTSIPDWHEENYQNKTTEAEMRELEAIRNHFLDRLKN